MLSRKDKTFLNRVATKSFVITMGIVFIVVYILSNSLLVNYLMSQTNGNAFVESNILYASKLGGILQAYGDVGRTCYVKVSIIFDFIFPLQYSLFFVSCLILLLKKVVSLKWQKAILALGGVLCLTDWLENIFIMIAIFSFPEISAPIPLLAQTMTLIKSVLTIFFLIVILFSVIMLFVNVIKKRK